MSTDTILQVVSIVLGLCGPLGVALFSFGVKYVHDMSKSVSELNEKIGRLVTKTECQEKVLDDVQERLVTIERDGCCMKSLHGGTSPHERY